MRSEPTAPILLAPPAGPAVPLAPPAASAVPTLAPLPEPTPSPLPRDPLLIAPPVEDPSPQVSAPEKAPPRFPVRVGDTLVLALSERIGDRSPEERARLANKALSELSSEGEPEPTRVAVENGRVFVYVGEKPILQLTEEDALAAGETSLATYADRVAADVREALLSEHQRARVARGVFSGSLVVFLGLVAFYLMRRVATWTHEARSWVEDNPEKFTLHVREIELVRSEMLQSASLVGLGLARLLAQLGIFYAWLVVSFSLFDATRGYTKQLTGVLLTPLSELTARLAITLPVLLVLVITAFAVLVLVRFVELFFSSVAKHETTLSWIAPDLAPVVSVLVRVGIVLGALVFAAPVVTGDSDGALTRVGLVVTAAFALASTPVLASALVGVAVVLRRVVRVGEYVRIGDVEGLVVGLGLLDIRVQADGGRDVRIPCLTLLKRSVEGLGKKPLLTVELAVDVSSDPEDVERELRAAAQALGPDAQVELVRIERGGWLFRVQVRCDKLSERGTLNKSLIEALRRAHVQLASRGST